MKKCFNFILLVFGLFLANSSFGQCEKIFAVKDVQVKPCGEIQFNYIIEKGNGVIHFDWIIDNLKFETRNDFFLKFSGKRYIRYTLHISNDCSDYKFVDSVYLDYEPVSVMAAYALENCTEAKFHFIVSDQTRLPKFYEWTGDDGLLNTNEWEPTHIYPGPGTYNYSLKYLAEGACEYSYFNGTVVIKNTASAEAGNDKTICMYNGQQLLTGIPAGGIWTGNGVDGNTFNPEKAGNGSHKLIYTTHENQCFAADNVTIIVKEINPDFLSDVFEGTAPLAVNFSANHIANFQNVSWDFGDAKSQSLNTSLLPNTSHTYHQHGEYNVTLSMDDNETGCSGQRVYKKMIRVSEVNNPSTKVFSQGLVIYPNPTRGEFKFVVEKPDNVNYTIEIIAINGQLLCSSGMMSLPSTEINLSYIANSLYLVRVNMDNGKTLTGKLVLLNF